MAARANSVDAFILLAAQLTAELTERATSVFVSGTAAFLLKSSNGRKELAIYSIRAENPDIVGHRLIGWKTISVANSSSAGQRTGHNLEKICQADNKSNQPR